MNNILKKDLSNEELTLLNECITNSNIVKTTTTSNKLNKQLKKDIVLGATKKGYLNLIKYIHKLKASWDYNVIREAVKNGHKDCLEFLHINSKKSWLKNKNYKKWERNWKSSLSENSDYLTTIAGYYGKLDCLKYLCENNFPYNEKTLSFAVLGNNFECVKYLHSKNCKHNIYATIQAAFIGNLDLLKYLVENNYEIDESACLNSARKGHLDCLKYAYEIVGKFSYMTAGATGRNGHLECLKFIWENSNYYDHERPEKETAIGGQLECLQFMYENKYSDPNDDINNNDDSHQGVSNKPTGVWADSQLLRCAGIGGNVKVVEFLHNLGCPWDPDIYSWSTSSGEVIKYLYENEQGWNPNPFNLKSWYCKKNGHSLCTGNHEDYELQDQEHNETPTQIATRNCSYEGLRALHECGFCWGPETICSACYYGNVKVLKYAHENGCPWNERASIVASSGNIKTLKYLIENGCPYNKEDCIESAKEYNQIEIIEYLSSLP